MDEIQKSESKLVVNRKPREKADMEVFKKLVEFHAEIRFPSEEENSTDPFFWEIPERDDITIKDIIELGNYSNKTLYKISGIDYFNYPDNSMDPITNKRYNTLLETLRNDLIDTKIFWVEEYEDWEPNCIYVKRFNVYLVGKTKSGNFAGITSEDSFWSLKWIRGNMHVAL